MRAAVSIVIPTLNAGAVLPATLAALFEGLQAGVIRELIVSDGGSTDETLYIADEVGAKILQGEPSRGGQLQRGVAVAKGAWVLVLHADTVLAPGWSEAVLNHIEAAPDRAACFRLGFDSMALPARIVAGWANLRTRVFGLPFGDQGLLISRVMYDALGGYPDIPLMEDVAMARALKGRITLLAVTARTSARRYETEGWFRRGLQNLLLQLRFLTGSDPERLARRYRRSGHRS